MKSFFPNAPPNSKSAAGPSNAIAGPAKLAASVNVPSALTAPPNSGVKKAVEEMAVIQKKIVHHDELTPRKTKNFWRLN